MELLFHSLILDVLLITWIFFLFNFDNWVLPIFELYNKNASKRTIKTSNIYSNPKTNGKQCWFIYIFQFFPWISVTELLFFSSVWKQKSELQRSESRWRECQRTWYYWPIKKRWEMLIIKSAFELPIKKLQLIFDHQKKFLCWSGTSIKCLARNILKIYMGGVL